MSTNSVKRIIHVLVLTVLWDAATAAPIETCSQQWPCLNFGFQSIATNECSNEDCEYRVCMTLHYDGGCAKNSGTVSHTCEKPGDQCLNGGGFNQVSTEVKGIEAGYSSCQIVPPGGFANFLLKDGNAKNGCGFVEQTLSGIAPITCETFDSKSCTGNGNVGKECVWKVQAPSNCGKTGGGGGDPHIRLWNRTRYSYHGECDLVLAKNKHFDQNKGLDIHIRTTMEDFYSYIEAAALRIGDSILEVSGGQFWINGQKGSDEQDLPTTFSGYVLHAPYMLGTAKIYHLDLNNGDKVFFRNYKHFMSVDVSGSKADFGNSLGLLGDYTTSDMLARNGTTVISDTNDFGAEWQVQEDEPKLFRMVREPQLPHAACKMPTTTAQSSRRLRGPETHLLVKAAKLACAGKSTEDFEFCVLDVVVTKDVDMARAW